MNKTLSFVMKYSRVLLLLLLLQLSDTIASNSFATVWVEETYSPANLAPTGLEKVYINGEERANNKLVSEKESTGGTSTFDLKAEVGYGYAISWSEKTVGAGTMSDQTSDKDGTLVTYSVKRSDNKNDTIDYWAVVTFSRREITWGTPPATSGTVTWNKKESTVTSEFPNNYARESGDITISSPTYPMSPIDRMGTFSCGDIGVTIPTTETNKDGSRVTDNSCSVNLPITYTMDVSAADNLVHNGTTSVTTALQASGTGTGTASSLGQVYTVKLDLTPNFIITSDGTNKVLLSNFKGSATENSKSYIIGGYGSLPIDNATRLTWHAEFIYDAEDASNVYAISEDVDGDGIFTLNEEHGFTVTYTSKEEIEYVPAMLNLTATWRDKNDNTVSHSETIRLSATNGMTNGLIEIKQNGNDVSEPIVFNINNVDKIATTTFAFNPIGVDVSSLTIISDKTQNGIVVTHTNGELEFIVSGNTFNESDTYIGSFTVQGTDLLGEPNAKVERNFEIQVKRWYSPITLSATAGDTYIDFSWNSPATQYASAYKLYKDGALVGTYGADIRTARLSGFSLEETHTYKIVTTANGVDYTSNEITVTTTPTSILDYDNRTIVNGGATIDFEAAFNSTTKAAIMDELYLVDNVKNMCYVYHVNTVTTPWSYKFHDKISTETSRVGKVIGTGNSKFTTNGGHNKRVYIAGQCDELNFYSPDKSNIANDRHRGWMQPINCHIYLDNVSLAAKRDATILRQFVIEYYYLYAKANFFGAIGGGSLADFDVNQFLERSYSGYAPYDASVFFLLGDGDNGQGDNTTTFHLRGDNYLGGGMGKKLQLRLLLDVHVDVSAAVRRDTYPIYYYAPNYGSPIAIKQRYLYAQEKTTAPSNVTCVFNTIWPEEQHIEGSVDLAARACSYEDQHNNDVETDAGKPEPMGLDKFTYHYINWTIGSTNVDNPSAVHTPSQAVTNDYDTKDENKESYVRWANKPGQRYAPAIGMGGTYGKIKIESGHVNLWPANGIAEPLIFNYELGNESYNMAYIFHLEGARYANMVFAGIQEEELSVTSDFFVGSAEEIYEVSKGLDNEKAPFIGMYGVGQAIPIGEVIVEGGTISAETKSRSYAYNYKDESNTAKTADNVSEDNSNQPLIANQVTITGGTFRAPMYAKNSSALIEFNKLQNGALPTVSTWNDLFTSWDDNEFNVQNVANASVYRAEFKMDAANKDYSHYMDYTSLSELPEASAGKSEGITIAGLSGTPYRYGMTGVRSDDNNLCWFYFPKDANGDSDGAPYSNYYVASGTTLDGCFDIRPYNLTVEKGGIFNEPGDETTGLYHVYGTPKYVLPAGSVTQDQYTLMAMPFDLARFEVKDDTDESPFLFNAYVETDDNGSADNTNAYCYVYFLDYKEGEDRSGKDGLVDGVSDITTQFTKGYKDEFRMHYHTHTDGLMKRGKTYVVKFPESTGGDGYWESWPITLVGKSNSDVNGANAYTLHARNERPTVNGHFYMDGNATFAQLSRSVIEGEVGAGQVYLVDHTRFADDDFYAADIPDPVPPMQGYLLSPAAFARKYPRLSDYTSDADVTTGIDATGAEAWKAFAADRHIFVTPVADGDLQVYTVNGELVGTYPMIAGAQTIIPASAGMYILRSGDSVAKVVVP